MPLRKRNKTPTSRLAAAVVFLAICAAAVFAAGVQPTVGPPWYSIRSPLLAVTLALLSGRIFLSLGAAVVGGGLLSAVDDPSGDMVVVQRSMGSKPIGVANNHMQAIAAGPRQGVM